ncbi:MAG: hypothetical protein HRF46_03855 [Acidobacteriota bacterium]
MISQWGVLGAVARLGAAGPLGALPELLPRGPWRDVGAPDDPEEVARLRPGAASAYRWAAARGLLYPLDVAPLRAANLARWARRWNLGAPWLLRAGLDLLRGWEADPRAAEALDLTPALRGVGYFTPSARLDPITGAVAVPEGWELATPTRARRVSVGKRFEVLAHYQCAGASVRRLAAELAVDRAALRLHLRDLAAAAALPLRRGGT